LGNFAGRSGRVAALLVVAIARYDSSSRLAPHPATAAKLPNLSLRGALGSIVIDKDDDCAFIELTLGITITPVFKNQER
jgi:hypothetical protein